MNTNNKMRSILIIKLLMLSLCTLAQIKGIVREKDSKLPMEFVNVTLLSASDSAFITGTTTDSLGMFIIPNTIPNGIIKVSYIGCNTQFRQIVPKDTLYNFFLQPNENTLKEVIVKGKTYLHTSKGIIANIASGPLAKLGNGLDVLSHLPFIISKNGNISVLGKGKPLIFINNRLVRNQSELHQINSSDIKRVEIITNPGAEYDATISAVVKIITSKPIGEGIGYLANAGLSMERKLSHYSGLNIKYRKKEFDVFADLRYNQTSSEAKQCSDRSLLTRQVNENMDMQTNAFSWNGSVGLNYEHRDKVAMGAIYRYTSVPDETFTTDDYVEVEYSGHVRGFMSNDKRKSVLYSHYINSYFSYYFTKDTYLKIDFDYMNSSNENNQDYFLSSKEIHSKNHSNNMLYAYRAKVISPLVGGTLTSGTDGAFTTNKNRYSILDGTTLRNSLSPTSNVAKQQLYSIFSEYEKSFGTHWDISMGIRFEYMNFNYYNNSNNSTKDSQKDKGFYPSTAINYKNNDVQMTLAYRYTTLRPSYFMLRNSVEYNNPYEYEGGTPNLLPQKTNMFSFSLGWKDLQVMANYSMMKNSTMYVYNRYNGSDSIAIFHTQNIKSNQTFDIALYYSPIWFKIWRPSFTIDFTKPFLVYNKRVKYNKPIYSFLLDNIITLPKHFQIG
ncbi:TonB-dependent receptor domain-containing protein, partial [Prevotella disiens]|uniref:TonB-dependent receptor domain-containing protein n=1 Tax=Prevotella disiens TaxID=28130 RepID=UPI0015F3079E